MATVDKTLLDNAYTSNIGQRLFAYTYYGDVINKTIADQFKKSLIFLGYEGQIWSPLTNTYVGIGKTAYDITTAYVQYAHAKIDALNTALTFSLVSSIYANWGEDDWKETTNGPAASGTDDGWESKIGASNKIVLKGIGDYDTVNDYRMNVEYAHVTDENSDATQQGKLNAATRPLDEAGKQWATSGITVSLTKGKNWYRWERLANPANGSQDVEERDDKGNVTKWADHVENGKVSYWFEGETTPPNAFEGITFEATDGATASAEKMTATCYVPVYNGSNKVYKNGKNVFTIDDTQTWSYITARNAEIMQMTKDYTSSEVNRIYAELLGINNGGIIPVSYNQIWNVAANKNALNSDNGADDLVAVDIPADKIYFKKVTIDLNGNAEEFIPQGLAVTPFECDGQTFYYLTTKTGAVAYEYSYFANYYDSENNAIEYVLGVDTKIGDEITFIEDNQKPAENKEVNADGTLTKFEDGTITQTSGHKAQYNLDYIYKRIKTIDEVTSGSEYFLYDASLSSATENINLADGINTLKEVAHVLDLITNGSLLEPGNPENSGIELAYSIAQNHVDIIDLDRRLDKIEAGENAVCSLREATNGPHLDLHLASDTNRDGKYYQDVTITASLNLAYNYSAADTVAREKVFVPTWNADANGNITLAYTVDGNTTVPTEVNRTHEGLVTTSWALSYGVELRQAIVANDIELNKHLAYAHSYALINALDGSSTASNSKLVCGYTQTNGAVAVQYRELPTDHITASATVWGEFGDTALKVYTALTDNIVTEAIALQTPIYKIDGNTYVKTSNINSGNISNLYFLDADQTFKQIGTYIGTDLRWTDAAIALEYATHATSVNYYDVYETTPRYVRVDSADLKIDADGKADGAQLYTLKTTGQPADQVKYISASAVHHNDETEQYNDGSNTFHVTAHITKISDATETNSGLADAYDVKNAIDNIFGWVDLSEWASNNPLNRTDAPAQA